GGGTGSGLVIRGDGYILTNHHVIDGAEGTVQVLFSDGKVEEATIVGSSPAYDLAVVKVERDDLTPLVLGDSDAMVVGDPVVAVGSPLGLESTVTTGIVSAQDRPVTTGQGSESSFMAAIQTDAAINPGNSGGPLLNMSGEVIGINSAVAALPGATQATGAGSVGLGFAIPSNQARRVAEELIADGSADVPAIGAQLDTSYTGRGVRVADSSQPNVVHGVVPGSPATRLALRKATSSSRSKASWLPTPTPRSSRSVP
ncbi:trypsin-like peptidase domain-containing protein, partial [Demequina sp. TTPB684]|uniref:S1C family serine protease n=1 Tax=Demequina sp. TTPB684 TaxID=2881057 RepID=UPI001CF2DE4F